MNNQKLYSIGGIIFTALVLSVFFWQGISQWMGKEQAGDIFGFPLLALDMQPDHLYIYYGNIMINFSVISSVLWYIGSINSRSIQVIRSFKCIKICFYIFLITIFCARLLYRDSFPYLLTYSWILRSVEITTIWLLGGLVAVKISSAGFALWRKTHTADRQ